MAKKKTIEQMSSDELYELAKARLVEEQEAQKEQAREQIEALREERRELVAQQRKELAIIDRKIAKLRGTGKAARGRAGINVSTAVMDVLATGKKFSTKEIQAALSANGIVANNLSQTLAYLKRQGKVKSPARSVYALA